MTRLHGWAPRGESASSTRFRRASGRPRPSSPRCATTASKRPACSTGTDQRRALPRLCRAVPRPDLKPGDVVILDNLGSHKGKAVRKAIRESARASCSCRNTPQTSTRSSRSSPSSKPCCERSEREPTRPSPTPAAKSSPNIRQPNAPHTSRMPGMRRPKRDTLMVEPRTDCDGLLNCADTLRSPGTTNETGGSDCGRWRNATFAPIAGVPGPFCRRVSSTRSGHRALEARPIERVNRPGAVENCGGGVHLVADFS